MARLNKGMGLSDTSLYLLKQKNILTLSDYLREDAEKLSDMCNSSFKEILDIRQNMIANFSALPIHGSFAYQHLLSSSALIPTGINGYYPLQKFIFKSLQKTCSFGRRKFLDELLQGGFLTGSVLELCGLSGEGKTQSCLTISAHVASVLKHPIYYVDTKGDFSAQRVLSIMQHRNINEQECDSALERILVTRVNDIYEVLRFLHHLKRSITEDEGSPPRVVILDSLPALYFPFMGSDDISQGFGLLNHLMSTMKVMATEFHMLFIEVNLVTNFVETEICGGELEEESRDLLYEVRPLLGKYWLHGPNTRLLISRLNNEAPQRLIRIIKSTYLPIGSNCIVCVNKQGVV